MTNDLDVLGPIDGRRVRGQRTRGRIIDAILELADEGDLRPTGSEIATRANIALRTLYHHFENVDGLRLAAFVAAEARAEEHQPQITADGDVHERATSLARGLRRHFEAITPIRRSLLRDQLSSPDLSEVLKRSRRARRRQLEAAFAAELRRCGSDRRAVLDALDVAISWESWNYARTELQRSARAVERLLAATLPSLLDIRG